LISCRRLQKCGPRWPPQISGGDAMQLAIDQRHQGIERNPGLPEAEVVEQSGDILGLRVPWSTRFYTHSGAGGSDYFLAGDTSCKTAPSSRL